MSSSEASPPPEGKVPAAPSSLRIAIVLASLGRPKNLAMLMERLDGQTLHPAEVMVSVESNDDLPTLPDYPFRVQAIFGPRGSCHQRNRALDALSDDIDIVLFYDDDLVPSRYALEGLARFFEHHPDIAGATGYLLRDGIHEADLTPVKAGEIVDAHDATAQPPVGPFRILSDHNAIYGCNMSFRKAAIGNVRFDEAMPLYGWLEDIDFGHRIGGRMVSTDAFVGVHCGEKAGREKSGVRLGYSQICNPAYLVGKGTMARGWATQLAVGNFLANHLKAAFPEPWIDRLGRAKGNRIALADLVRGRAHPSRILDL